MSCCRPAAGSATVLVVALEQRDPERPGGRGLEAGHVGDAHVTTSIATTPTDGERDRRAAGAQRSAEHEVEEQPVDARRRRSSRAATPPSSRARARRRGRAARRRRRPTRSRRAATGPAAPRARPTTAAVSNGDARPRRANAATTSARDRRAAAATTSDERHDGDRTEVADPSSTTPKQPIPYAKP